MVHLKSFAKDKAAQFVAQLLDLLRVASCAKAFSELKECFLFFLSGFDTLFDKFHQHTVVAEGALFGDSFDLFGDSWGQGYATTDLFGGCSSCAWHSSTSVHHFGASMSPGSLITTFTFLPQPPRRSSWSSVH